MPGHRVPPSPRPRLCPKCNERNIVRGQAFCNTCLIKGRQESDEAKTAKAAPAK